MSQLEKIRRQQLIRQAEGYLDLLMCLDDQWPPDMSIVETITEKALRALDRLDVNSGRRGHVAFLRGQAYRIRRDFATAAEAFQEALEYESENVHIHLGLAWCYKRRDQLALAIESLQQAIEIQPDHPVIIYNLACYWALTGDVLQTCKNLSKAIELDPGMRELVESESDFDSVRDFPEFQAVTAVVV